MNWVTFGASENLDHRQLGIIGPVCPNIGLDGIEGSHAQSISGIREKLGLFSVDRSDMSVKLILSSMQIRGE